MSSPQRRSSGKNRQDSKWLPLTLGFVAGVSGLLAAGMGYGSRELQRESDRAASLSAQGASSLREGHTGEDVLVEGKLASDNPVLFHGLVTYLHYEPYKHTTGNSWETRWRVRKRFTPPLWVDTGSGRVRIRNEDYELGAATDEPGALAERGSTSWKDEEGRKVWDLAVPSSGPQWYTGFEPGQGVVVLGTLARGGETPEVEAVRVFGGTQAELVASARSGARLFLIMAWVLGPLSVAALLGLGWVLARRLGKGRAGTAGA
jgi:hypothetical protein